jgi:hypothetical protein
MTLFGEAQRKSMCECRANTSGSRSAGLVRAFFFTVMAGLGGTGAEGGMGEAKKRLRVRGCLT